MVGEAIDAAERLAAEGIEAEVIDPRTLVPLDLDPIAESVRRTGRAVVAHEAVRAAASAPSWPPSSRTPRSTIWRRRSSASARPSPPSR